MARTANKNTTTKSDPKDTTKEKSGKSTEDPKKDNPTPDIEGGPFSDGDIKPETPQLDENQKTEKEKPEEEPEKESFVTKSDLEKFKKSLFEATPGLMRECLLQFFSKTDVTEAVNDAIKSGKPLHIDEFGKETRIDPVHANDLVPAAELEKFMNEFIVVKVHKDARKGSLRYICPMVNGVNQVIVRGVKQHVRRKFVEAMARGVITEYDPIEEFDYLNPKNMKMHKDDSLTANFEVYGDTERGQRWLKRILSENR